MARRNTGLDEQQLARLVDRFYDKVRTDAALGPLFNAVVDDWAAHKRLLTSFWSTVALGSRSYHGNPLRKHRPLPIEDRHFERWLALWQETAREVLDEANAARMTTYAQRVAVGLRVGLRLADPTRDRKAATPFRHPQKEGASRSS